MRKHAQPNRRKALHLGPLLLLALGVAASFVQTFDRWDKFIYDSLSRFNTRSQSDNIIIVAIDEHSLGKYGRWPWRRHIHAELIDKLSLGGAKAVGFDILFAEPDTIFPEDDQLLAEAITRNGKIILPVISEPHPTGNKLQLTRPIPILAEKAAGLGHVDFELDIDGIMRRVYLLAG